MNKTFVSIRRVRLLAAALLFAGCIVLMGNTAGGCSGGLGQVTPSTIQTGIATAQSIITTLMEVLKPAVDTASSLCTELTKDGSAVRAQARFECASITDAWNHVVALAGVSQQAIDALNVALQSGDPAKIDDAKAKEKKASDELNRGVTELKGVLAKSPTIIKKQ